MHTLRSTRPVIATAIAAAAIAVTAPLAGAAAPQRHGGSGGGGTQTAPAPHVARLPASWPKDVPVPPGRITGTTAGRGQWSAQLLVRGSAAHAMASTTAFYKAHGFRGANGVVHRGIRRVQIVVENRDHSNTATFVVIAVTRYTG